MKGFRFSIVLAALALSGVITSSAFAQGPVTITSARVQPDQHLTVTWAGPSNGIEFGTIQLATRPDTGTAGDFYTENRIEYVLLSKGQSFWLSTDRLPVVKKAGALTLYARVNVWDDFCQFYDYGYGITGWSGCDVWSQVYSFTIQSVCSRTVVKRGHYVKRGKRRVWIKPTYRTDCHWQ